MSSTNINRLVADIARNGVITLDLAQILQGDLRTLLQQRGQQIRPPGRRDEQVRPPAEEQRKRPKPDEVLQFGDDSSSVEKMDESEDSLELGSGSGSETGGDDESASEDGAWKRPRREWDEDQIGAVQWQRILRNPEQYIEFVYQNRRFKLKPIGTIEPVPKVIHQGVKGGLYYYTTQGPNGEELPRRTRVYLKPYQVEQCLQGQSSRARGASAGLAGYVIDGNNTCLNQPPIARRRAAREPRQLSRRREAAEQRRR